MRSAAVISQAANIGSLGDTAAPAMAFFRQGERRSLSLAKSELLPL